MTNLPKRTKSQKTGISAADLLNSVLSEFCNIIPVPQERDLGIDFFCEIMEGEYPTGKMFNVQCKGKEEVESKKNFIRVPIEVKTLNYWSIHPNPTFLFIVDRQTRKFYWTLPQNHLDSLDSSWQKQAKLSIPVDKENCFSQDIKEIPSRLLSIIEKHSSLTFNYRKRMASGSHYTILSLSDSSHAGAKRYSAKVLLNKEFSKPEIVDAIKSIICDLRKREYYRNEKIKQLWKGKDAQVVWLFLCLSLNDLHYNNWICRAQWISKDIHPEFSPIKFERDTIDSELTVDWNNNYSELSTLLASRELNKEDYLFFMNNIFMKVKPIITQVIELTAAFNKGEIEEEDYLSEMIDLESKIDGFYHKATDIGAAPIECRDLSQRFQCFMSIAHNITLPFSERGLKTWEARNRSFLVNQNLGQYDKELLRLEFELEKVQ